MLQTLMKNLDRSIEEHQNIQDYAEHYNSHTHYPSPFNTGRNNMFNKSSGLSLTQRASGGYLHPQNSTQLGYSPRTGPHTLLQTGPWAQTTTHGKASFASVMDSQDMSKGIARSIAFDMQQEAEQ